MESYIVEILEPEVLKLLGELENLRLIKLQKAVSTEKKERTFGSMKGLVIAIADDFNAPLEDFKEFM